MRPSDEEASLMLLTIGIILVATVALAALEVWLFWLAGQRVDRRRTYRRNHTPTSRTGSVTHLQRRPRRRGWRQRSPDEPRRTTDRSEREGWQALASGNGGAYYREHLSANAVMAFPFGILTREDALEAMEAARPWERFEIRDPRVIDFGHDSGVVVYSVVAHRPGVEPYAAVASTTFVRDQDR
jgi:Domain of unknown function (DUF4440)